MNLREVKSGLTMSADSFQFNYIYKITRLH
jgi:hypothetical protein